VIPLFIKPPELDPRDLNAGNPGYGIVSPGFLLVLG
jgi:hypothetical protein